MTDMKELENLMQEIDNEIDAFKKECDAQSKKRTSDKNYALASQHLLKLNNALERLKEAKQSPLAINRIVELREYVSNEKIPILVVITNEDTTHNVMELNDSSSLKQTAFHPKGVAIGVDSRHANNDILKMATNITLNCHWSTKNKVNYQSTENLVENYANAFKEKMIYPRLNRFTILGCMTASEVSKSSSQSSQNQHPHNAKVFVYKNNKKGDLKSQISNYPCFVLKVIQGKGTLVYFDKDKNEKEINNFKIKSTKLQSLNDNNSLIPLNKEMCKGIEPAVFQKIYEISDVANINDFTNPYLLRATNLSSIKDKKSWVKLKGSMTEVSNLFFKKTYVEPSNLAEKAANIIHGSRKDVEIKGYTVAITPDNKGFMKPMGQMTEGVPKSVIIKP